MRAPKLDTTVVRTWRRYPGYKESASDWLGQIPQHWDVSRVKRHCTRLQSGSTPPTAEQQYYEAEEIPWYAPGSFGADILLTKPAKFIAKVAVRDGVARLFPAGSTMLVTIGATIGKVGYIEEDASSNQQITAISFNSRLLVAKYAAYQIKRLEPVLQGIAPSTTLPILDQQEVGALPLLIPPIAEQRSIAAFLDRETTRIDTLIERKARLIALLEEKRQAIISQAVTRGLDPRARLKDSSLPGLGSIPAHWAITRLKFVTPEVTVGVVVTPSIYYVEDGVPALRGANVREGRIEETNLVYFSTESNWLLSKSMLRAGDLVAVRTGQPGTTAVVPERLHHANCIDLILIRRSHRFNSHFLCYLANSRVAKSQYGEGTEGAIQQHFNIETAKNMTVFLPPLEEQEEIVKYLDQRTADLAQLIDRVTDGIARLQEYRSALISAAVTGQIDVRDEV